MLIIISDNMTLNTYPLQIKYNIISYPRYRHYGVYLTHEDDDQLFHTGHEVDDNLDILRNPVIVLDKNAESYINLRYPTLSQHDLDKKC